MGKEMLSLSDFKKPLDNPQEVRAEERNFYLPIWKKIFCPTTVKDIYEEENNSDSVLEEAQKMNEAADKLVQGKRASNYTEAVEMLIKTDFKTKNRLEIFAEECARAAALKFGNLMDLNEFQKASKIVIDVGREKSPIEHDHRQARENEIGKTEFSYGSDIASRSAASWREDLSIPAYSLFEQYTDEIIKQKFLELSGSDGKDSLEILKQVFSYRLKKLNCL